MTQFYAQPYDLAATGFYFDNAETYSNKIRAITNDYGEPVEEFEVEFIDGEHIDCDLAKTWGINQANILKFMEVVDEWDEDQKRRFILAVGECCYSFDPDTVDPDDFEVDIYHLDTMKALAEQFVDEGLFGDIPDQLTCYIDLDAIARDLSMDYAETQIAGQRIIYRCA
ncbi:antirestriction protein ArdA [Yoonia sp. SS1-5]|uniref:Antirestriction protein ArdA n=1 Tax=Yoonia rhodophyticola TaxID=3137370 RepID=A0AAN0M740_9RHOB